LKHHSLWLFQEVAPIRREGEEEEEEAQQEEQGE